MEAKRILVGLDGSPREALVLSAAQNLALRFGAELLLVRAVGLPPEIPPEAWQDPKLSVKEYLEAKARDGLERCAQALSEPVRLRSDLVVVVATPWQALCMTAQSREADIIVIGSHGYGGSSTECSARPPRESSITHCAPCSSSVRQNLVPTTCPSRLHQLTRLDRSGAEGASQQTQVLDQRGSLGFRQVEAEAVSWHCAGAMQALGKGARFSRGVEHRRERRQAAVVQQRPARSDAVQRRDAVHPGASLTRQTERLVGADQP